MSKPTVCIVSPASAADNNGNWHTAARWKEHLDPVADVRLQQRWDGRDADLLIALHARKSADAIADFAATCPESRRVVVLTGTDVYRDIDIDLAAQRSLALAHGLVCLQARALERLEPVSRAKAQVIVQGAEPVPRLRIRGQTAPFVAVGHLRTEKDPRTLFRAAGRVPVDLRIEHIGGCLDPALGAEAESLTQRNPAYTWLGALPHEQVRRHIAQATALVHMSRIEGGANVVIEAIVSGTPVLASRIDGNLGLLGEGYGGYFPPGDDAALAALMARCHASEAYVDELTSQCRALVPRYSAAKERSAVRSLLNP